MYDGYRSRGFVRAGERRGEGEGEGGKGKIDGWFHERQGVGNLH